MATKNAAAVRDGQAVRASCRNAYTYGRKRYRMAPDDVIAIIRRHVRRVFGDEVENKYSQVHASRGFFFVRVNPPPRLAGQMGRGAYVRDIFWRQELKRGVNLRRFQVGLALRAMHGERLTG